MGRLTELVRDRLVRVLLEVTQGQQFDTRHRKLGHQIQYGLDFFIFDQTLEWRWIAGHSLVGRKCRDWAAALVATPVESEVQGCTARRTPKGSRPNGTHPTPAASRTTPAKGLRPRLHATSPDKAGATSTVLWYRGSRVGPARDPPEPNVISLPVYRMTLFPVSAQPELASILLWGKKGYCPDGREILCLRCRQGSRVAPKPPWGGDSSEKTLRWVRSVYSRCGEREDPQM